MAFDRVVPPPVARVAVAREQLEQALKLAEHVFSFKISGHADGERRGPSDAAIRPDLALVMRRRSAPKKRFKIEPRSASCPACPCWPTAGLVYKWCGHVYKWCGLPALPRAQLVHVGPRQPRREVLERDARHAVVGVGDFDAHELERPGRLAASQRHRTFDRTFDRTFGRTFGRTFDRTFANRDTRCSIKGLVDAQHARHDDRRRLVHRDARDV